MRVTLNASIYDLNSGFWRFQTKPSCSPHRVVPSDAKRGRCARAFDRGGEIVPHEVDLRILRRYDRTEQSERVKIGAPSRFVVRAWDRQITRGEFSFREFEHDFRHIDRVLVVGYHLVDEQLLTISRVLHLHLIVHSAIQSVEAGCELVVVVLVAAHEHVVLAEPVVAFAGLEGREVACAAGLVVQAWNVTWRQLNWGVHEVL